MPKQTWSRPESSGFAAIEALLILIILAAVVGIGGYVVQQKRTATKTLAAPSLSSVTPQATASSTAASVEQLTQQEALSESGVDKTADNQVQQSASSTARADSNVGGAYNENNL